MASSELLRALQGKMALVLHNLEHVSGVYIRKKPNYLIKVGEC